MKKKDDTQDLTWHRFLLVLKRGKTDDLAKLSQLSLSTHKQQPQSLLFAKAQNLFLTSIPKTPPKNGYLTRMTFPFKSVYILFFNIYRNKQREMLGKKSLSSDFFSARMISSICLLIRFLLRIIIKSLMVTLSLSQICPPLIMSKSLIYVWFMHDLVFSFW